MGGFFVLSIFFAILLFTYYLEPKAPQPHLMTNLNYRTLNDLFPLKQLCFLIGKHII
jgi:hypothetical protein